MGSAAQDGRGIEAAAITATILEPVAAPVFVVPTAREVYHDVFHVGEDDSYHARHRFVWGHRYDR